VAEVVQALASKGLQGVIIVGQLEKDRRPSRLPHVDGMKIFDWPTFLKLDNFPGGDTNFWRGPSMTPIYILYSSGRSRALPQWTYLSY
jgi:acetoacetyl-CoA synthetase